MLFSDYPRTHYRAAPVHEVICQLRFPPILSINQTEPADFQEAVRAAFPRYSKMQTVVPPKITGYSGTVPNIQQMPPVMNYQFFSEDGRWKLNLTRDFVALSTLAYTGWEDFARMLDQPLAQFIQLYHPAFFQRVGLRYVNILSRQRLSLEGLAWSELLNPAYCGALLDPDMPEDQIPSCAGDVQLKLDSSCRAKIHTAYGLVKSPSPKIPQDPEKKFIFDMDLSMGGDIPCTLSAGALETLHAHATRLFEGAITDSLRRAMDPV